MAVVENIKPVTDTLRRPLHDLRISVTDKCNLRCTYCMPADHYHENYEFLKREDLLTFEEIARIARAFVEAGVSKLRSRPDHKRYSAPDTRRAAQSSRPRPRYRQPGLAG